MVDGSTGSWIVWGSCHLPSWYQQVPINIIPVHYWASARLSHLFLSIHYLHWHSFSCPSCGHHSIGPRCLHACSRCLVDFELIFYRRLFVLRQASMRNVIITYRILEEFYAILGHKVHLLKSSIQFNPKPSFKWDIRSESALGFHNRWEGGFILAYQSLVSVFENLSEHQWIRASRSS